MAAERPETLHDFGGFPEPLYQMQYPSPGDPALADQVVAGDGDLLLLGVAVEADDPRCKILAIEVEDPRCRSLHIW